MLEKIYFINYRSSLLQFLMVEKTVKYFKNIAVRITFVHIRKIHM